MTTKDKVTKAVYDFIQGGDERNVSTLDRVLHPQFRSTVNKFAGSTGLTTLSKSAYLQLINENKIGGTARNIAELAVDVAGPVAMARVEMKSEKLQFISFYKLVENEDNAWQLVSDMPYALPK
jgi:hypothetical protein